MGSHSYPAEVTLPHAIKAGTRFSDPQRDALALHMLLFVSPCLFSLPVCIHICVLLFV